MASAAKDPGSLMPRVRNVLLRDDADQRYSRTAALWSGLAYGVRVLDVPSRLALLFQEAQSSSDVTAVG